MKDKSSLFRDEEFQTPSMCTSGDKFDCVAVAINEHGVAVRSTNDPSKKTVVYTQDEWRNFIAAVRDGAYSV